MKKIRAIIFIVISLIILTWTAFFIADRIRVKNMLDPVFCIRTQIQNDGGSTEFIGLGYKVFKYVDFTEEKGFYVREIFIASIFDDFNKPNYEAQRRIEELVNLRERKEEINKVTLYNYYNGIEEINYAENKEIVNTIIDSLIEINEDDEKYANINYSARTTICIYFDILGDYTNYVIDKTNLKAIEELNKIDKLYDKLTIDSTEISKMTIRRYSDEKVLHITNEEEKKLIFDSCIDSTDANDVIQVYMKAKKNDGKYVEIYSSYKYKEVPDEINKLFESN